MVKRGPAGPAPAAAPWILVETTPPPAAESLLMVDALHRLGARSVEREGDRVVALFHGVDDPESVVSRIELAIRASTSVRAPAVTWRPLGAEEWAARWGSATPPVRVSERLLVSCGAAGEARRAGSPPRSRSGGTELGGTELVGTEPGGPDASVAGEARLVRLDPSVAFGSAEHPTTRACLRAVDRMVRTGDRLLDVGAGSGVISIAGVLLGAERARAFESDPAACAAARRNAALNGVEARVHVREMEVRPGSLRGPRGLLGLAGLPGLPGLLGLRNRRRWDGVVANLPAAILRPLIPDLEDVLVRSGWLILSGVLRAERDAVVAAAERAGLRLEGEEVDDGWWTGRLSSGAPRPGR